MSTSSEYETEAGIPKVEGGQLTTTMADQHIEYGPPEPTVHIPPHAPEKLTAALAAIMAEVGVIQKTGWNEGLRYRYAGIQDVLGTLTPLLARHGVIVMQTEAGKTMFDQDRVIAVEYEFTIAHSSGEVWPDRPRQTGMSGCRHRNGAFDDKCLNKCHTAARKYFLMALFQIATGDTPDADKGENDGAGGRKPQAKPDAMKADYPSHTAYHDAVPPHDSETGEILPTQAELQAQRRDDPDPRWMKPHKIDTARDGKNRKFIDWTQDYISGIAYVKDMTELVEWQEMNAAALNILKNDAKGAGLYKRITDVTQKVVFSLGTVQRPEETGVAP
jgi:ERF superfamily